MPNQHLDWTVDMLTALPDDGNRYEVIDGELFVTPAPTLLHLRAIARLHLLLAPFVELLALDLLFAPAAVTFSPRRELQPDLLVLPRANGRLATRFEDVGVLLLAVEVLSPHTARVDRLAKRVLYQQQQVPEYWIIDPNARVVERWRPESEIPELHTATLEWRPVSRVHALRLDLVEYFRGVHGD